MRDKLVDGVVTLATRQTEICLNSISVDYLNFSVMFRFELCVLGFRLDLTRLLFKFETRLTQKRDEDDLGSFARLLVFSFMEACMQILLTSILFETFRQNLS